MVKKKKTEIVGRHLSAWLSRKSERMSKGTKKLFLLLAFASAGCYCLMLIVGNSKTILFPQNISLPGVSKLDSKAIISQRIQSLDTYLDSLQTTTAGRATYDSLLRVHPKVYDSIANWKKQLEKLP